MMKKLFAPLFFLLTCMSSIHAQNVGIGTTSPKASAALDVTATNKGFLMPRLTTDQRKAIVNPERGLLVFDTDKGTFMFFDGVYWKGLGIIEEEVSTLANRNEPTPSTSHFGQTVDISGNYAIIGAPFYASPAIGNKMGEAYIFFKDESGWKSQARIVAPDSTSFDFFGSAVAIYGDYCVVGVSHKVVGENLNQGKVYVYKRNGTTWNYETSFIDPNGAQSDNFGWSVDITYSEANTPLIAAGTPFANNSSGKVLTYSRDPVTNTWSYLQTLTPVDLVNYDNFGLSVSMHKDYLVIGAPNQTYIPLNATSAGAAYVYVFGGGVFTQQQKIEWSYASAEFGYSLSLFEDKLAIGAPWAIAYGGSTGSAIVNLYKRTGANWDNINDFDIQESEGGSYNMRFGLSLSLSDNQLLIGAPSGIIFPNGSSTGGALPGAAYLYATTNGGIDYYPKQKFTSPNPQANDLFGHGVSIEGTGNFIIGIPYQPVTTTGGITDKAGGVYFGYYAN